MNDLPQNWTNALIGELTAFHRGVTYSRTDARNTAFPEGVPILRAGNLQDGRVEWDDLVYVPSGLVAPVQFLRAGDIVVAMSSGSASVVGKAAIVTPADEKHGASFGAFCGLWRPRDSAVAAWTANFFQTDYYRQAASSAALGVNINNLRQEHVASLQIPLPPPAEQRRIVCQIDSLTTRSRRAKKALDAIPALLTQFRQSVLAAAFRGDLTADWREKNPDVEPAEVLLKRIRAERRKRWEEAELAKIRARGKVPVDDRWKAKYEDPEPVDTSELPELPEGWVWTSLGDAFDVCVGATPSRAEPSYWGGEVPWVSSGEVAFCRIGGTREKISHAGLENSSTEVHPVGTVLLGMIGEGRTRGQAAILDIPACNNQNAAAIRVSDTAIPPEYVYRFLEGEYERTRQSSAGNNQPALNKSRVQSIRFPLASLEEQREIVRQLERMFTIADGFDRLIHEANDKIRSLNRSILAKAFRGELVEQDPSDEPASVLLERIRKEASTNGAEKTKRGRRAVGKSKTRHEDAE